MSVSCSSFDLEDSIIDREKRNIESSSSKVENEHVLLSIILFIEPVGYGSSGGLVDYSEDVYPSDGSCVLCGLSLAIVEVGWYSDHCVLDSLSKVSLSCFFHLGKDHRGDFFRIEPFGLSLEFDDNLWFVVSSCLHCEGPVLHVLLNDGVVELSADQSLGIEDGIVGIFGHLVLGCISDESLCFCEGDIGRSGPVSLIIGDDLNSIILPNTDTGVGGAQVDSDSFL